MKRARMSLVQLIGTGLALITLTSATLAQAPAAAPVLAP